MPNDNSGLVAARDALNADVGTLLNASSVTQAQVDTLTAELVSVDSDVKAVINAPPPTPLDFAAFDAAVVSFKANVKTQAAVDNATAALSQV